MLDTQVSRKTVYAALGYGSLFWLAIVFIVLCFEGCATTRIVPQTPMELLAVIESGNTSALQSATSLVQSGAISISDLQAVMKKTDEIDQSIMQSTQLMSIDPTACEDVFNPQKDPKTGQVPQPTQAQFTACEKALNELQAAQQKLLTLQQSLNQQKGK